MWKKSIAPLIALALALLVAHRIWRATTQPASDWMESRSQLTSAAERELHLTPGGAYTQADIDANGRTTPRARYASFQARHDLNPQPGDPLCPITRTKASPDCTWIIAGRTYQFCCLPCIDEFVRVAKDNGRDLDPPMKVGKFETPAEARRKVNQAIAAVAERLGNTKAICRKCYVHPAVIEGYEASSRAFHLPLTTNAEGIRSSRLSKTEAAVKSLLRGQQPKR